MSKFTPRELQTIFPIEKKYDGEKYGSKDYYYTKQYIEDIGEDEVIGEQISDLLWEYQNWELNVFMVNLMSVISGVRQAKGKKRIIRRVL